MQKTARDDKVYEGRISGDWVCGPCINGEISRGELSENLKEHTPCKGDNCMSCWDAWDGEQWIREA